MEIAAEDGTDVIDLFTLIKNDVFLWSEDGVHLTKEGYQKTADVITEYILKN